MQKRRKHAAAQILCRTGYYTMKLLHPLHTPTVRSMCTVFSHLCAPYGIHPSCHTCHRPVFFWLLPAGSCLCLWIIWSVHLLMASRAVSSRDKCPISVPLLKSRACHPVWYKERWIYLDCIRPEVLWSGDFLPDSSNTYSTIWGLYAMRMEHLEIFSIEWRTHLSKTSSQESYCFFRMACFGCFLIPSE